MRIISWNVNGIRSILTKGFYDALNSLKPDVVCLQEIKALEEQVDINLPGYNLYWNSAQKKGYSGTAIFTKHSPIAVSRGLADTLEDNEGRVITAEFNHLYLVNVYTPNVKRDLSRLKYRCEAWDRSFLRYVKSLETTKPVVLCGDLNVAHQEIDLKNYRSNKGNAGFTDEERAGFERILSAGFVDIFRHRNPEEQAYTWWSYFGKAREKNVGWRIDYFLVSSSLLPEIKGTSIAPEVLGSDHCPVVLDLKRV